MIVIIIVALVVLKYFFNVSLSDIIHSQIITDIWTIIKQVCTMLWDFFLIALQYLKQLIGVAQTSIESLKQ